VPGTTDIGNHCNGCNTAITFPFPVSLYGTSFTTANVSSNGNIQFETDEVYGNTSCPLPDMFLLGGSIMPYQGAGRTSNAGEGIFTLLSGTAPNRVFNIEWRTHYSGTANFEVRLFENTSTFEIIYGATVDSGSEEESGVQRTSGGPATQFSCRTATLTNGLKVIYSCPAGCDLTEGFDNITTLVPGGWVMRNNSQPGPGATNWFQGNTAFFPSQSGVPNSYIAANYDNGTGTSTLSNWLLTPLVNLQNGAQLTFWTRTVDIPAYADRLQVRMSTNGGSTDVGATATDVGDFITLLLDINPAYTLTDYPNVWTQFTVTLSGIASPTIGRLAFRYFVENGGPTGANSDYIGIDTVQFACTGGLGPSPTPTPPPISISGTIPYCSNPIPGPAPNVTLTLTGNTSATTLSDGSGNYIFSSLPSGGNYTVTPTKAARTPGSANINTSDVIATQRHFLNLGTPLSGCQLLAADVNGDSAVNTSDVIAIQRFFLGMSTGIANVGKYKFIPANRSYTGVTTDQTAQNYDTLIFGDVASHFAE
jgi:hypothetical protein